MNVPQVIVWIQSNAPFKANTLRSIGAAFDAHPALRPARLGDSEPFRNRVGDSLSSVLAKEELPLSLLGVNRGVYVDFEFGSDMASLQQGLPYSATTYILYMSIDIHASRFRESIEDTENLFGDLCVAMEADLGYVMSAEDWENYQNSAPAGVPNAIPNAHEGLLGVTWMHYFGPAYLEEFLQLKTLASGPLDDNGGFAIRLTDAPVSTLPTEGPFDAAWKAPLSRFKSDGLFARTPEARGVPAAAPAYGPPDIAKDGLRSVTSCSGEAMFSFDAPDIDKALVDIEEDAVWSTTMDAEYFIEAFDRLVISERIATEGDPTGWVMHALEEGTGRRLKLFECVTKKGPLDLVIHIEDETTVGVYVLKNEAYNDYFDRFLTVGQDD